MRANGVPYCTLVLSVLTIAASLLSAWHISGSPFGRIRVVQLEAYGGITLNHVEQLELWRLVVAQLLHVKQLHMIYNVLSLMILGWFVERFIGSCKFFTVWFVAGAVGTLASTLAVDPPWNLGTGGSQALMGLAAVGLLMLRGDKAATIGLKCSLVFALIPALAIDVIFAGYPKPGHLVSFCTGLLLGAYVLRSKSQEGDNVQL